LIDAEVRRTWQIGADRVRIEGRYWPRTLDEIVQRAAEGLGISDPVSAQFYKLLVYDEGSFFVSHRDTEKAPGMFATLVIVLPSLSAGGELLVRHKDREVRLDLRCQDPSEAVFAAFYADCVHEVLPITAGYRLALVYNLLRQGRGRPPEPPGYESEQNRIAALLRQWARDKAVHTETAAEKLVYPLEHAYTSAELGFAALKGADAAAAGVLAAAARQAGYDLLLALLSIEESGSATHSGGCGRGRWSEPDEDEFEVDEIIDHSMTLSDWRQRDGGQPAFGAIPVENDEIAPPDALEELEPDEQHFHEATGNEGASFERTYRRAVLALWPHDRILAVLSRAGLPATLPYLTELAERWADSGDDRDSPLWRQAQELAGHMMDRWPIFQGYDRADSEAGKAAQMAMLLTRLEDPGSIERFLADISAAGDYGRGDNEAIIAALALLAPGARPALLERIVAGTAATALLACGDLLLRALGASPEDRRADLRSAAVALVEALPGDPTRSATSAPWRRQSRVNPDFVANCLTALGGIDPALAQRAVDRMLAWRQIYDPDAVLVPAMRILAESRVAEGIAAVEHLRAACLDHLRARIAEPPAPPHDWRRAGAVGCRCPHCTELSRFLADPGRRGWVFKAAAPDRNHVENTIRNANCDLDTATETRGRPYSLVCTKNQASYDRRVRQHEQDLADLRLLTR
jgi:hypothetical protein